jgi:peroxiredoxin Q/BCP
MISDIKLLSNHGQYLYLKDIRPSWLVLFFYPKDDTPHCTRESIEFENSLDDFKKLDTIVVGVSKDSIESHNDFAKKYSLTIPLLCDSNKIAKEAFKVENRSTFLINEKSEIAYEWRNVNVDGHVNDVLLTLKKLKL